MRWEPERSRVVRPSSKANLARVPVIAAALGPLAGLGGSRAHPAGAVPAEAPRSCVASSPTRRVERVELPPWPRSSDPPTAARRRCSRASAPCATRARRARGRLPGASSRPRRTPLALRAEIEAPASTRGALAVRRPRRASASRRSSTRATRVRRCARGHAELTRSSPIGRATAPRRAGHGREARYRWRRRMERTRSTPETSMSALRTSARATSGARFSSSTSVRATSTRPGRIAGARHIEIEAARRAGGHDRARPPRRLLLLPPWRPLRDGRERVPPCRLGGLSNT